MAQKLRIRDESLPHAITLSVVYEIPVFSRDDYFRSLADSLTFCTEKKGVQLHGFVIMPSQIHMICSQVDSKLTTWLIDFRNFTSRAIVQKLTRDEKRQWLSALSAARPSKTAEIRLWEDDYEPEEIKTEPAMNKKLDYIHNAPCRAGFLDDPTDWKYSSAGFYYLQREPIVPVSRKEW